MKSNRINCLIRKYMNIHSTSFKELEDVTGLSNSTLYRCMNEPELWRLGDLCRVYTFLNIPNVEREFSTK